MPSRLIKPLFSCILFCGGVFLSSSAFCAGDDKSAHIGASAAITTAFYVTFRSNGMDKWESAAASAALAFAIGGIKEISDSPMDISDVTANGQGVLASSIVLLSVDW